MSRVLFDSFKTLTILAVAISFWPGNCLAQEQTVVGEWDSTASVEGEDKTYLWSIKEKGGKLNGHLHNLENDTKYTLKKIKVANGQLSFEFDLSEQGEDMVIRVEGKLEDNELSGSWSANSGDNELASGSLTAKKKQPETEFAGTWETVALLPDGEELESTTTLKGKNTNLKGTFESANGNETDVATTTVKGDSIKMEFSIDLQGTTRNAVIEAKATDQNTLKGEWILLNDNGDEEASGDWSGTRVVEYETLFDGKSMDAFRGYAKEKIGAGWSIVDGTIHLSGEGKSGDIVSKKQYADFELMFEWKMTEGGNSGVMYRVSLAEKKPWHTGAEYQLLDDDVHKDGKDPSKSTGSIYAMYTPKNKTVKPIGEWNSSKIVLRGNNIEHWLNGNKVAEAEVGSDDWNERFAASKFSKLTNFAKNKKGHLCFQDHGDPFWLRNIRIKELGN